ncbi:MAG: VOC family protein [Rhodospirillaceae bacterium]|nr:VOC family protein [Rhodospirillaceae bacterium]
MVRHVIAALLVLGLGGGASAAEIELRGIGWIVLRSKDPERLARYYAALGFEEWARSPRIIGFRAGGGAVLEIGRLDAATPDPMPKPSRTHVQHAAIVGTKQAKDVAERARAAGAAFVETYMSGDVAIYYIADPDGNVIGFAEDGPMWGNADELKRVPDVQLAPGQKP